MILTASLFPGSKINDLIMNEGTCRRNKFTNKPDSGLKIIINPAAVGLNNILKEKLKGENG